MVRIIWNDITKEPTDAVVTLASAEPKVGSGVDTFVHAAAGKELLKERLGKNPKMVPGDVVFTKSYGLKKSCGAKNVIHVASVVWRDSGVEEALINAAYLKAAVVAKACACKTISFPVMGAGRYAMPKERALKCAYKALKEIDSYLDDMQLKLLVADKEVMAIARQSYGDLCSDSTDLKPDGIAAPAALTDEELLSRLLSPDYNSPYWINLEAQALDRLPGFAGAFDRLYKAALKRDRGILDKMRREAMFGGESFQERRDRYKRKLIDGPTALSEAGTIPLRRIKNICGGNLKTVEADEVWALCAALQVPGAFAKVLLRHSGHLLTMDERDRLLLECLRKGDLSVYDIQSRLGRKAMALLDVNKVRPCPKKADTCSAKKTRCKKSKSSRD